MPVLPRRSTAEEWIWSTTACVIMTEPACNTRTARTQSLPAWFMNAAGSILLTVAVVIVGFLSLLHAQLESEAGEGFLCGVIAKSRPLFFGDPASGFHPCFALRGPLEE